MKGTSTLISTETEAGAEGRAWHHTPLTPGLGKQRQVDPCKSEASLVYIEEPGLHRVTT